MAMVVRGPDGKTVSFPDGTDEGQINAVMTSIYSRPKQRGDIIEPGVMPKGRTEQRPERASGLPSKAFRETVGERVGVDNPAAVKRYTGALYPFAEAAAVFGDATAGATNAVIAGGAQTIGNLIGADPRETERAASSLAELVNIGGLFAGGNPAAALPRAATPRAPSVLRENVETLERAGIEPRLATAAQRPGVSTTANVLGDIPFIGRPLKKGAMADKAAAQSRRSEVAATASATGRPRSPMGTGNQVQAGIDRFANGRAGPANPNAASRPSRATSAAEKGAALFARVGLDGAPVRPTKSAAAVKANVSAYADPALAAKFKNSNLDAIEQRLSSGEPLAFEDMQRLRRDVWKMGADPTNPALTADNARIQSIYGALTDDMREAARAAGREKEFLQANKFWAASRDRINRALKTFTGNRTESGESTYKAIIGAASSRAKADVQSLAALRRSLPDSDWADVAATIIDQMGQTDSNDFSVGSFARTYRSLSPEGRKILFSQSGRPGLAQAVDDLAAATDLLAKVEQLGNPSGSGRYINTMATAATTGTATMTFGWPALLSIPAARGVSAGMASPKMVRWMAGAAKIEANAKRGLDVRKAADAHAKTLAAMASANEPGARELLKAANDNAMAGRVASASDRQEKDEQERR